MTTEAIYEHGILRPLQPLKLKEGEQVHITVSAVISAPGDEQLEAEKAAVLAIAALPLEGPADDFSGADHDRILYGKL